MLGPAPPPATRLPGAVAPTPPDRSSVGSIPAEPIAYEIDPTVAVKAGGVRVAQFSGDPRAARAAIATPEVQGMLRRMLADLDTFTPQRGRLIRDPNDWNGTTYVNGVAGSPVGDDIRVISEQNVGNRAITRAIAEMLQGKMPTNRLHTAALDAAMGYLEGRPGYRGPSVPAEVGGLDDDEAAFEAFSKAVDDLR